MKWTGNKDLSFTPKTYSEVIFQLGCVHELNSLCDLQRSWFSRVHKLNGIGLMLGSHNNAHSTKMNTKKEERDNARRNIGKRICIDEFIYVHKQRTQGMKKVNSEKNFILNLSIIPIEALHSLNVPTSTHFVNMFVVFFARSIFRQTHYHLQLTCELNGITFFCVLSLNNRPGFSPTV